MALYAIGDVQGCYESLRELLNKISFDLRRDRLWFTGDLVNRGPRSLEVLRFVAGLGDRAVVVLGNHDLHLLAVAAGAAVPAQIDKLNEILSAHDSKHLLTWLAKRPLFYHDADIGCSLVHAGLLPSWDIAQAQMLAREAEGIISGPRASEFFREMYGDTPDIWSEQLAGWDRLRLIVNAFTRVRFCYPNGRMDHQCKGAPGTQPSPLLPWFQLPHRRSADTPIVFGHWSLLGCWDKDNVVGVDTGCFWGGQLTAVRLIGGSRTFVRVGCGNSQKGSPQMQKRGRRCTIKRA